MKGLCTGSQQKSCCDANQASPKEVLPRSVHIKPGDRHPRNEHCHVQQMVEPECHPFHTVKSCIRAGGNAVQSDDEKGYKRELDG